jgi:hypothetical protein
MVSRCIKSTKGMFLYDLKFFRRQYLKESIVTDLEIFNQTWTGARLEVFLPK